MPYKHEELKIPRHLKKSVKLSQSDREEIKYRYLEIGGVSQRGLAREYEVSRRLIYFCIYPEKQEENYRLRQKRGGSAIYYDKQMNTDAVRRSREYKQELYIQGKLEKENK